MSYPPPPRLPRPPARSMGLKLLLVCALALLMAIPALFVFGVLKERSGRAAEVARELGATAGGPQSVMGPVLAVPWSAPGEADPERPGQAGPRRSGLHLFYPVEADARVRAATEVRKRSLFRARLYTADLDLSGRFDLSAPATAVPVGAELDWSRAEFLVGVSDPRGARSDITLLAAGRRSQLAPATLIAEAPLASDEGEPGRYAAAGRTLRFFSAPAGDLARPGMRFSTRATLRLAGAERLAVLPYGRSTRIGMSSSWPHPSFEGGFLSETRSIGQGGFDAAWSIPFIARGVGGDADASSLRRLGQLAAGTAFVEPANPYQSVERSLKYAPMFIGLVFLAYFIFEVLARRRMHAAQYVLVGLAQLIFYLLLLSIAEQIGFDPAFAIAATATVGLISLYAGWVFESRARGLAALAAFGLLYGLIYVLMRLEDMALLLGASASFAAIAAVMYFTRGIDWYGMTGGRSERDAGDAPA